MIEAIKEGGKELLKVTILFNKCFKETKISMAWDSHHYYE